MLVIGIGVPFSLVFLKRCPRFSFCSPVGILHDLSAIHETPPMNRLTIFLILYSNLHLFLTRALNVNSTNHISSEMVWLP